MRFFGLKDLSARHVESRCMYNEEHDVSGFVVEGGESAFITFKTSTFFKMAPTTCRDSRATQTVAAGEGGGVQSARGGGVVEGPGSQARGSREPPPVLAPPAAHHRNQSAQKLEILSSHNKKP